MSAKCKKLVQLIGFCLFILTNLLSSCKKEEVPTLTTTDITNITGTSAISGGNIINEGTSTVLTRGVCWSTNTKPTVEDSKTTDGAGAGSYSSSITGLTGLTTYYVRAYATNETGTGYGMTLSFTTKPPVYGSPVKDYDGNSYTTVIIGSQTWMAENLKTTKLNDGTIIPNITNNAEWGSLTSSGYCWYDNDITNKSISGALYNWFTISTNKICPAGWHVPNDSEWENLINYLGGEETAYIKLKEAGTDHWGYNPSGPVADNESGFTAIPGGLRYKVMNIWVFQSLKSSGFWWSTTESNYYSLNYSTFYVLKGSVPKASGLSIRCIKNY